MKIDELDILERVEAYKLKGLPDFLEERPSWVKEETTLTRKIEKNCLKLYKTTM